MKNTLGLKREHPSTGAYCLGKINRMSADVRANIDHGHPRTHGLFEELDLALGKFTVQIQRAADVTVVRIEHHHPVLTLFEPEIGALEKQMTVDRRAALVPPVIPWVLLLLDNFRVHQPVDPAF